ncbi:hypothetical protein [Williamwhitmania taraxaci]|uniref:Uncharacterized protein n=1 Tax=Williamwhitmania taraxaci TaxID=1640674 RepID=A0A1G6SGB4_9BACT|nr:hypothetical protein [Williamwhitmania taraxaci]SDD15803.1 hypothetical protein SAMN05216323_10941 [Williamwhitmania taraxaci]
MKNVGLNACGVQEMNAAEVDEVIGGSDIMDLIQSFGDATPWGSNSTWTNIGGGAWDPRFW